MLSDCIKLLTLMSYYIVPNYIYTHSITPRWRYLNLARLPIPPYPQIKFLSSKFYTARTSEAEHFA